MFTYVIRGCHVLQIERCSKQDVLSDNEGHVSKMFLNHEVIDKAF